LQSLVQLKLQLFLSFKSQMKDNFGRVWPDILELLTKCEVLFEELFRLESPRDFRESWGFWHVLQNGTKEDRKGMQNDEWDYGKLRSMVHKYRMNMQLGQMLESTWNTLLSKAGEVLTESLRAELIQIGEPFRRYMAKSQVLSEI
jgi:heptaprenyl diphosphate synthase